MPPAYLEDLRQQRDPPRRVVGRLIEQREAYLAAHRSGTSQGFDGVIARIIDRTASAGALAVDGQLGQGTA